MRKQITQTCITFIFLSVGSSSSAFQIGPELRFDGKNLSIGGVSVGSDGIELPSVDDLIDSTISSTPLTLLSDSDKGNIKEALKTTAVLTAVVSDPITGMVIATIISADGTKQDIPVPTVDAPPTGETWSFTSACIVQSEGNFITAMFRDEPADISSPAFGDTLNLAAPYCPEYGNKSVTSVVIKFTGRSDFPDAQPPVFRHYLVGNTI